MLLKIQLSDALRNFVETEAAAGGYDNAGAYIGELVAREARRRAALLRLEELGREGIESGEPVEVTPEWWERMRAELAEYLTPPPVSTAAGR